MLRGTTNSTTGGGGGGSSNNNNNNQDGSETLSKHLSNFRRWLKIEANCSIHPSLCIVNGEATDGTKNAPVLLYGPPKRKTSSSLNDSGNNTNGSQGGNMLLDDDDDVDGSKSDKCGTIDRMEDQRLWDNTIGCQVRCVREIKKDEVLMEIPKSSMLCPTIIATSDAGRAVFGCIEGIAANASTSSTEENNNNTLQDPLEYWESLLGTANYFHQQMSKARSQSGTQLVVNILRERKRAEDALIKARKQYYIQQSNNHNHDRSKDDQPNSVEHVKPGEISSRAPLMIFLLQQRFGGTDAPVKIEESTNDASNNTSRFPKSPPMVPSLQQTPSSFAPWIKTLPSSFSLPLCWKRNELALLSSCVGGLPLLQEVAAHTHILSNDLILLLKGGLLHMIAGTSNNASNDGSSGNHNNSNTIDSNNNSNANTNQSLFPLEYLTWDSWVWAAAAQMSRAFPVDCYLCENQTLTNLLTEYNIPLSPLNRSVWEDLGVLIPFMDMLNHEPSACQIRWERAPQSSQSSDDNNEDADDDITAALPRLVSQRRIKKGAQIFTDYGSNKSNQDLIAQYGFAQVNNPADYINIAWGLNEGVGNHSHDPIGYEWLYNNEDNNNNTNTMTHTTNILNQVIQKDRIFESDDITQINNWWNDSRLTLLKLVTGVSDDFIKKLSSGKKLSANAFVDRPHHPVLLSSSVVCTMSNDEVIYNQSSGGGKHNKKNYADDVFLTKRHQRAFLLYMLYFYNRKLEKLLSNLNDGLIKTHYPNFTLWHSGSKGGLFYDNDNSNHGNNIVDGSSSGKKDSNTSSIGWQRFFELHAYTGTVEVEKHYYSMTPTSSVLILYDGNLRAIQARLDDIMNSISCNDNDNDGIIITGQLKEELQNLSFQLLSTSELPATATITTNNIDKNDEMDIDTINNNSVNGKSDNKARSKEENNDTNTKGGGTSSSSSKNKRESVTADGRGKKESSESQDQQQKGRTKRNNNNNNQRGNNNNNTNSNKGTSKHNDNHVAGSTSSNANMDNVKDSTSGGNNKKQGGGEKTGNSKGGGSSSGNNRYGNNNNNGRQSSTNAPPAIKLHIGNLSYSTKPEDLFYFFSNTLHYGPSNVLECHIPTERDTGKSRGFGFVTMPEEIALNVLDMSNNLSSNGEERKLELHGRVIKLAKSNTTTSNNSKGGSGNSQSRSGGGGGGGKGGGSSSASNQQQQRNTNSSNNLSSSSRCTNCGYRPKYCTCSKPQGPGPAGRGASTSIGGSTSNIIPPPPPPGPPPLPQQQQPGVMMPPPAFNPLHPSNAGGVGIPVVEDMVLGSTGMPPHPMAALVGGLPPPSGNMPRAHGPMVPGQVPIGGGGGIPDVHHHHPHHRGAPFGNSGASGNNMNMSRGAGGIPPGGIVGGGPPPPDMFRHPGGGGALGGPPWPTGGRGPGDIPPHHHGGRYDPGMGGGGGGGRGSERERERERSSRTSYHHHHHRSSIPMDDRRRSRSRSRSSSREGGIVDRDHHSSTSNRDLSLSRRRSSNVRRSRSHDSRDHHHRDRDRERERERHHHRDRDRDHHRDSGGRHTGTSRSSNKRRRSSNNSFSSSVEGGGENDDDDDSRSASSGGGGGVGSNSRHRSKRNNSSSRRRRDDYYHRDRNRDRDRGSRRSNMNNHHHHKQSPLSSSDSDTGGRGRGGGGGRRSNNKKGNSNRRSSTSGNNRRREREHNSSRMESSEEEGNDYNSDNNNPDVGAGGTTTSNNNTNANSDDGGGSEGGEGGPISKQKQQQQQKQQQNQRRNNHRRRKRRGGGGGAGGGRRSKSSQSPNSGKSPPPPSNQSHGKGGGGLSGVGSEGGPLASSTTAGGRTSSSSQKQETSSGGVERESTTAMGGSHRNRDCTTSGSKRSFRERR